MAKVITYDNLIALAKELAGKEKVVGPVLKHPHSQSSQYIFEQITKDSEIAFKYPTTVLPPMEFLLPPVDPLFSFEGNKATPTCPDEQIIFGLNLEDLEGISLLGRVFEDSVLDLPFENRLGKTHFVAIDRFSPPESLHYDVYLAEHSPGNFVAVAKTPWGRKLLTNPLFSNSKVEAPKVKRKNDALLARADLPKIVENSRNHPVWKELAEICFGCGICSYTCPLCYCFEMEDQNEIGKESGMRCRSWDSCLLSSFADTNAGNFREDLADRIYNWYFHKFVRMPEELGFVGCVGCNRCAIYCPAKINYRKTLERLVKDYKK